MVFGISAIVHILLLAAIAITVGSLEAAKKYYGRALTKNLTH